MGLADHNHKENKGKDRGQAWEIFTTRFSFKEYICFLGYVF